MNLVDSIKSQLTSEVTSKLGSLLGGSENQVKSALGAAIPALLSAFSGVASGGGADKLASALNDVDTSSLGRAASMLSSAPERVLEQGQDQLGSLLGSSTISGLAGTVARFLGLDSGVITKLLSYISPLVLGNIAKQFQGEQVTPRGLTKLFAEQKANIANALPSGLSLANVPGLPEVGAAAANVARTAQSAATQTAQATSPLLKTLLPLAVLAAIGFLAWQFLRGPREAAPVKAATEAVTQRTALKPVSNPIDALPDVATASKDLTSTFDTATDALGRIKDAATAEAELPKLSELTKKLDGLKTVNDKLPEAARSTLGKIVSDNIGKLTSLIEKVLAIPGVKEKVGPVVNELLTKLKGFQPKA